MVLWGFRYDHFGHAVRFVMRLCPGLLPVARHVNDPFFAGDLVGTVVLGVGFGRGGFVIRSDNCVVTVLVSTSICITTDEEGVILFSGIWMISRVQLAAILIFGPFFESVGIGGLFPLAGVIPVHPVYVVGFGVLGFVNNGYDVRHPFRVVFVMSLLGNPFFPGRCRRAGTLGPACT